MNISKQRTILIVDDNINNIDIAVQLLRAYSFRILVANNGEKGLERAGLANPDLILLDIRMPGIDGIETCRRLKANPNTAEIPVIFMTAMADTENKVRGLEAGAVDYVTKPIEEAELLARVQTHLALSELRARLETEVQERTQALEEEIQAHEKARDEREMLLALLREQSESLHAMTLESWAEQEKSDLRTDKIAQRVQMLSTMTQQMDTLLDNAITLEDPIDAIKQRMQGISTVVGELIAELMPDTQDGVEAEDAGAEGTLGETSPANTATQDLPLLKLSTREYEVFQLIAQGKSNSEISDILAVTPSTVSTYRHRIIRKLGIPDPNALVKYAVEMQVKG
ncbi:MAG: response regulator [Chloroflexota bacterium]